MRRERLEADRRLVVGGANRPELLGDRRPDLEPVRIVAPDEPVGRVEDRCERAVVAAQDDRSCRSIAIAEPQDVADRGAAELVDRLVVVADDGDVAVRFGEDRDELRLGAVRVLELVDEDVSEARPELRPGGRG